MPKKDITGQTFGRLIAIRRVGTNKWRQVIWLFKCSCGKKYKSATWNVFTGNSKSCGCLLKDHAAQQGRKMKIHGMSRGSAFYRVWQNMLNRCRRESYPQWKDYGGRGITVCKKWSSFLSFKRDMLNSYLVHRKKHGKDTFIDRINNDKGYMPSNCRWVTRHESNLNRRPKSL